MKTFTKRAMAALAATVTLMAGVGSMTASAKTVNPGIIRKTTNFLDTVGPYSGSYSKLYCQAQSSSITATSSDYNGSFKIVTYLAQKKVKDNDYVTIAGDTDSGTAKTVTVSISYDTSLIARRYYSAKCYVASNQSSGVADSYTIDVRKSEEG